MSSVRLRQAKAISKGKENEKRKELLVKKNLDEKNASGKENVKSTTNEKHHGRKEPIVGPRNRGSAKKIGVGGEPVKGKGFGSSPARQVLGCPGKTAENTKNSASCYSCQLPIVDDGVFALGRLFHTGCFRCVACGVEVGEDFHTRGEAACCNKCFLKSAERCHLCKGKITGDHIQVDKTFFHPECMKCQICKEVQTVCFLTYKGLPICEKHFKEIAPTCSECGSIVAGQVFTFNGRVLCENDFKALEMAEEYGACASCGDPLSPVDSITVSGVPFHHACLSCVVCKKSLEGKMVTLDRENKPYCTKDYTKKFSVVCAGCKKSITPKKGETKASRLRAMEKDYHLECFKCSDCSLVLKPGVKGKECWPIKEQLFCYKCYIRRPTAHRS